MPLIKYSETNLPTVTEMKKRWCFGLLLVDREGKPMEDTDIQGFIDGAISEVERRLGIYLKPMVIVTNGPERGLIKGVDYDISEPAYDYDTKMYKNWGFLQLRERPAIKLNGLKLVLPNGQIIVDFMTRPEWIKFYEKEAQIHIVPYAGDPTIFYLLGGSQSGFPFVTGQLNSSMPQMWYADYEAGYAKDKVPADIRNAVAKLAAIEMLSIASDAIISGVTSISTSIDGLSESVSNQPSLYGERINKYQNDVDKLFDEGKDGKGARSSERGITFTVL
jgi:hypothetical protein